MANSPLTSDDPWGKVRIKGTNHGDWYIYQDNTNGTANDPYHSDVIIMFEPNKATVCCQEMAFLQIERTLDQNGEPYEDRENFNNRMTVDGWAVDRKNGKKYGWYGYDNDGKPDQYTTPGSSADALKTARIEDFPGARVPSLKWEFEVAAICKTGRDKNIVYAALTWGFDADKNLQLQSHPRQSRNKPSEAVKRAVDAWNGQAKGPKERQNDPIGGNQELLGPFS